ncbi:FAD/NAD(P)-dependent oxidoreductase [Achromobacter aloeverae]|uniref:FAD/NAD(P)-binding oxidoreductase n=1 Tax=Achromobacter aloeverae TaxID=1750518 RepID=A0A4Q1HN01_9BURK|nr:FAD/NAD(P)-binding oxidoreductase [Achromobacter aloeverae]RXN92372.1 FAD/NAD(P)-binding oxidoreductase [Achromobacter aloeverae]
MTPRVVVVGAGPAGVRCAEVLVRAGLRPVLVDEGSRDGGQIYRRQPEGFKRGYDTLYGSEAARARALHETFDRLRPHIDYHDQTLAWNAADQALHLVRDGRAWSVPYDAIVVCAGATDRLMPVAGWQRAGCYSLGGAQIALKSQACAIGSRVVFMGTGPLLYLVAAQYSKAGARVAAVLDTAPRGARFAALPQLLARPGVLRKGMALVASLRRAGVALRSGITPMAVDGDDAAGVRAVRYRDDAGREQAVDCDAVAMGYHLRAETQLADLLRCEFRHDAVARQWLPAIDAWGRASVQGVYLAGDGARLQGADGAEASGALAGLAVLQDAGLPVPAGAASASALLRELARMERFRRGIARAFPWPAAQAAALDDTVMACRCEGITVGELRRVVREEGACEVNRSKAFSRVGMGRCQGRYCGLAGAEIVAASSGVDVALVGRLRTQAPVKPLPATTSKVTA